MSIAHSTSLTADGVDLSDDVRIVLRVTSGLFDGLEVRGSDTSVPGLAGMIARNRVAESRIIVAEGLVMGSGADETAQRSDFLAIRKQIDTLMRGDNDPYLLEVLLEDATLATILARPLRPEWGDERIPSTRELTCYWLSVVPDWTFSV